MNIIKYGLTGLISGLDNIYFRKNNIPLKPKYIVYEVTSMCNSRCKHCNMWQMPKNPNELTLQEIEKTFSDPLFSDVEYIIVTGGEPIIRPDMTNIFLKLHELIPKARMILSTNGLMPKQALECTEKCLEAGIQFDVGVSLDGIGKHHDDIRGVPGNYEKVDYLIQELKKLREKYPKQLFITAGTTISNLTIDYLDEYIDYCEKNDITQTIAWYQEADYYDNHGDGIGYDKTFDAVNKIEDSPRKEKWIEYLKTNKIEFPCYAMQTFFVLKNDGEVTPCLSLCKKSAGNVKTQTPTEIWNSEKANELRNVVKNCKGCLNSWAYNWSIETEFYPMLLHYIKRPRFVLSKILGK